MKEIQGQKSSDKGVTDDPVSTAIGLGKDIVDDKERAIAKAALSIAELGSSYSTYTELRVTQSSARLLAGIETPGEYSSKSPLDTRSSIPLRSVKVFAHETFIEDARSIITNEMENMVLSGLATLVSKDVT
jgi:conserved oligomeric Golgi complex subunit 5